MKRTVTLFILLAMNITNLSAQEQDNKSKVESYTFSNTLTEQERELANNPMLKYYEEMRAETVSDPLRPIFHYVNPEGKLNDPNGLCFWQGQWHLFYQAYPLKDPRQHWGHTVSDDLTHWRDLPLAIYPDPERAVFSGSVYVEDERAIAMYNGYGIGTMVATSSDPLLLNWEKVNGDKPVIDISAGKSVTLEDGREINFEIGDSFIWKEDGCYYALLGGSIPNEYGVGREMQELLYKSEDLVNWEFMHPFIENNIFTRPNDDGSCPYFVPLAGGKKHLLMFYSHTSGGQYMLGDYDAKSKKFIATAHSRLNRGAVLPSGVHAPAAYPDGKGGAIAMFNVNAPIAWKQDTRQKWNMVMTLPLRLTLSENGNSLNIEPANNYKELRYNHKSLQPFTLTANKEVILEDISGNAMEIEADINLKSSNAVQLKVLMSPESEEYTTITLYTSLNYGGSKAIVLDNTNSSTIHYQTARNPETAYFNLGKGESVKLHIFIDKSIVEVFVNGREYLCVRAYPGMEQSVGVSLKAIGADAEVNSFDAYQMNPIQFIGTSKGDL